MSLGNSVPAYFIDSSALVKRYVPEPGSPWVQSITAPQASNLLIICRIAWVEVLSALARRQREGSLTGADVNLIIAKFRSDLNTQYRTVEVNQALIEVAGQLVNQYPLRAYDAIQLASALRVQPAFAQISSTALIFIAADANLLTIAQSAGLTIDNPTLHP